MCSRPPLFARGASLPQRAIRPGSIAGGVLFGAGWAITGACPAILLVQIGEGQLAGAATFAGALVGMLVYPRVQRRLAPRRMRAVRDVARATGYDLQARIGIHSGPVVAGVIGARKFAYDVWGETVNTASRMESHSETSRIHVSDATAQLLGSEFALAPRGTIDVKGKGAMRTYFLVDPASQAAG